MKRRPAIIAYDISCAKRRRQVHKQLQSWSLDNQFSVFECLLSNAEARQLFTELSEIIHADDDKLMLVWLDGRREAAALTRFADVSFKQPVVHVAA